MAVAGLRSLYADLFIRDRGSARLTAAGERLRDRAHELLDAWDGLVADVNTAAAGDQQTLVVGIQTSVGHDLHRRTQAGFEARQPGWRLSPRLCPWSDPTAGPRQHGRDEHNIYLIDEQVRAMTRPFDGPGGPVGTALSASTR